MTNRRPLLFAKAIYFFYYGTWACLLPFLALYYKSLGFTGSQIGILASLSPLITLIAAPTLGGIADSTNQHKTVLSIGLLGAAASVVALSQARSFWLIALFVGLYAFFNATVIPLVDNAVLALLGERRDQYGAQRLWGAIGWGLAGPSAGALIGQFGLGLSFVCYTVLGLLTFLAARSLPIHIEHEYNPFWNGMRSILTDRRWVLFLMIVFISGAGLAVISNFLFLYMNELNASSTVMGFALTMGTLSEMPVLFFSGKMLKRWGPRGLLTFSLIAFVIRAMLYSAAAAPWQVLLIQLFHGLTFSTMWVAGVSLAHEMAPEGLSATAQGLFSSTTMGFGGIVGSLVGGVLLDQFGGKGMFFWMGIAVLVGLLIFTIASRALTPTPAAAPD